MTLIISTRWLALLLIAGIALPCRADEPAIPKYIAEARELVQNVKPEDNAYDLGGNRISFPGDLFSSAYVARADCSGFVSAMLDRADYPTARRMSFAPDPFSRHRRYRAEDFLYSIEAENGFTAVKRIEDMQIGDIIALGLVSANDKQRLQVTGHVMFVNGAPKLIDSREPIIDGTRQFEVSIVDSRESSTGPEDTRNGPSKLSGVGIGALRLYADVDGKLVGWARTFKVAKFFSADQRFPSSNPNSPAIQMAMGRPTS